jgi:hypothetical protein
MSGLARPSAPSEPPGAERVIARYLAARGGAERWRRLGALELSGTYAAFSKRSEFTLVRKRGDLFRLDFMLLDAPAVRARDRRGPWMQHVLLQPEAGRVTDDPYKSQLERESRFPMELLDHGQKGVEVELLGEGDVDGRRTINLEIVFPGGPRETWYLDAETFLEVAIDSPIYDHTQFAEPIRQRIFFDDFREVDGLMLPFQVEWEFGARLESMTVEGVVVDPDLEPARFELPAPPSAGE